ncbi:MAG: AAA family ATPase [Lachnospiraceae bacterium]|nr:AAA family ATPase [Lachnospiraceae bacterium]
MCKVIAIANQKGGVAKTTTAVNLGIGLAKAGKKVLIIDNDSQGSMTICMGQQNPDNIKYTLASIYDRLIQEDEEFNLDDIDLAESYEKKITFDVREGILTSEEGVDYIPSNICLAATELTLVQVERREEVLKDYIHQIKQYYDYVLIDCLPSLGLLAANAFACADSLLIPMPPAFLATKGLQDLIKTYVRVKRKINPKLKIEGIVFTMVDNTCHSKEIMQEIESVYGKKINVFHTSIPKAIRAVDATACGMSIYKYDSKSKVALAYENLTKEVLENEN